MPGTTDHNNLLTHSQPTHCHHGNDRKCLSLAHQTFTGHIHGFNLLCVCAACDLVECVCMCTELYVCQGCMNVTEVMIQFSTEVEFLFFLSCHHYFLVVFYIFQTTRKEMVNCYITLCKKQMLRLCQCVAERSIKRPFLSCLKYCFQNNLWKPISARVRKIDERSRRIKIDTHGESSRGQNSVNK